MKIKKANIKSKITCVTLNNPYPVLCNEVPDKRHKM